MFWIENRPLWVPKRAQKGRQERTQDKQNTSEEDIDVFIDFCNDLGAPGIEVTRALQNVQGLAETSKKSQKETNVTCSDRGGLTCAVPGPLGRVENDHRPLYGMQALKSPKRAWRAEDTKTALNIPSDNSKTFQDHLKTPQDRPKTIPRRSKTKTRQDHPKIAPTLLRRP